MQLAPAPATITRRQICKVFFYSTPDGELVAVLGNTHMIVTPEEATQCFQRLLDSAQLYRMLLAPAAHSQNGVAS